MQRSKSFTSIAFEQKQKQKQKTATRKSSPTRQSRPKPEWNDYLTDSNRFKVTENDILKKKKMIVSKHNILTPEYQPMKLNSALSIPRSVDNSNASRKLHSSSSASTTVENRSMAEVEFLTLNKKSSQEKKDSLDLLSTPSSDDEFDETEDVDNDAINLADESEEDEKEISSPNKRDISSAHLDNDEDDAASNSLGSYFAQAITSRKSSKAKKSKLKMGSFKPPTSPTPSSHADYNSHSNPRPRSTSGTTGRTSLVVGASSTTNITSPHRNSYPSPVVKKRIQQVHKMDASVASHSPTQPHNTAKFIEKANRIVDNDLLDIAQNIDHLQQELRLYEELAGKKSILDVEELQLILGTDENGTMNADTLNQKTVIRYLVSLVCQTMTYTLQSEVKQQQMETELQTMQGKLDEVLLFVTQQQQTNAAYSRYVLTTVPPTVCNNASVSIENVTASITSTSLLSMSTSGVPAASSSAPNLTVTAAAPPSQSSLMDKEVNISVNKTASGNCMLYGTSTSDWLFMAAKGGESMQQALQSPVMSTTNIKETSSAYHTPVAHYEYQLSPETAADLATRTYDLYLHQQQQQQHSSFVNDQHMKSSKGDNASLNDDASSQLDEQYDDMIDRLLYHSSSVTSKPHKTPSVNNSSYYSQKEGISIVMPNVDVPSPAKSSPHPFQCNLFPNSPPAAKKIYDASLGNYSLIDTYDN